MDVLFGLLGSLGIIVSIILLIIATIRKKPKKIALIMLIVSIGFVGIGLALPESEKPAEESKKVESEEDENSWAKEDRENFRVITQLSLNDFLSDYDTPGIKSWEFVKMEKDNVMAKTKVELKDGSKQLLVCIFTYDKKEASGQVHMLAIGGETLIDDGVADNLLRVD